MADSLHSTVQSCINGINNGVDNSNIQSKKQVTFSTRYVYNSRCVSRTVEYEMVRPLSHSMTIFRKTMNVNGRLSYADIVKSMRGQKGEQIPKEGRVKTHFTPPRSNNVAAVPLVQGKVRVLCSQVKGGGVQTKRDQVNQTKPLQNNMKQMVNSKKVSVGCNDTTCDVRNTQLAQGKKVSEVSEENKYNKQDNQVRLHVQEKVGTEDTRPQVSVQNNCDNDGVDFKLLYDVNGVGDDKFLNSIMFHTVKNFTDSAQNNCVTYDKYSQQSKYRFGFVPVTDPILPMDKTVSSSVICDPIQLHNAVKQQGNPNFIGARIPVQSQLNVEAWQRELSSYWDQQLLQFIQFGFPLGFNRTCELRHTDENHKSAVEFPNDIANYLKEELEHKAIYGPFKANPIEGCHVSPFMTRHKPDSSNRRVIIDLSWPRYYSVNDGIDKHMYMGSAFNLTFPTIDDLTNELVQLGKGAHIFKIDVSRAFRHLKIDPLDYDLLGLSWQGAYIDTCLPFGSRHGSQFFQRTSDAIRYIMRNRGFDIINYIDDFLGFGTPTVAKNAFNTLHDLMSQLGLAISQKKLVPPTTKAICLGIQIDTVAGTVSIPQDKLQQVKNVVTEWKTKKVCSKKQLQSLLGLLLYIHKCVKPARCFLNRMLEVLRNAKNPQKIYLTPEFMRDIRWFSKFLPLYNGISMYGHKPVNQVLELDACLTGLGGRWQNQVYHLSIPLGYRSMSIVHLEMVNILVAVRLFAKQWQGVKLLVKCDNEAVVKVLQSGRARDPLLGAFARNIWYVAALADIDIQYVHVMGKANRVADLLSRWTNSWSDQCELMGLIGVCKWLPTSLDLLEIDNEI